MCYYNIYFIFYVYNYDSIQSPISSKMTHTFDSTAIIIKFLDIGMMNHVYMLPKIITDGLENYNNIIKW